MRRDENTAFGVWLSVGIVLGLLVIHLIALGVPIQLVPHP